VEARLRILHERPTGQVPQDPQKLSELARGLGYGSGDREERLLSDLREHRRRIREAYEAVILGGIR